MQIQKNFRHLDVKRFLNRNFKSPSSPKFTSRRMALKQMSFLFIGASPLVKILGKSLLTPFQIQKRGRAIRFLLNKEVVWEIDPDGFGRETQLRFQETDGGFILELLNAEFPNTGLRTDFKAVISRTFGSWWMDIRFPHLAIHQKCSFLSFLKGETLLTGALVQPKIFMLGRHDQLQIPATPLTLSNRWLLAFNPDEAIRLRVLAKTESFDSCSISLSPPGAAYWINHAQFDHASWIALGNPQGHLEVLTHLSHLNGPVLFTTGYPFLHSGVVLATAKQEMVNLLWASNEEGSASSLEYRPSGRNGNTLALYHSRFVKEYSSGFEPFALVADLGETPQWIAQAGTAVALAGTPTTTFSLQGEDDRITHLSCQALVMETSILVAGARSLPVSYHAPAEVAVLPQDPVVKRTQTVKSGQLQTTGAIERVDTQERANWIYVNHEALKVSLKMDKPILFNLIRPEDFLNLQFEFVNFQLDGHLLKIDDKKDPAFLIVHFPSQHTREQAIKEGDKLFFPVKFKRAGNSRLVFRVPADYPVIPLTLEALLDWSGFDLQVNYRARWFNTTQALTLLKTTLMGVSMVFSSRRAPNDFQVKGAPARLQTREVKTIKNQQTAVAKAPQPMSALEVKVALATTPQGPGVMSLTDAQLGSVLATPDIELSVVDGIRGAMTHLYAMQAPSVFETSIEAPTYAQVSPNQFAGFNHLKHLKDEFGAYNETEVSTLLLTDEGIATPARPIQPGKPLSRQQIQVDTGNKKPAALQTKSIAGITVALPATRSYKSIVSPVLLRIPANIAIQQGQLFELWHSRMGIKLASGEVDENALNQLKTIRVLWSDWADEKVSNAPCSENSAIPFNVPNPKHFHELVHLTSNYTDLKEENTNRKLTPQPVKANQLMLSSLGAWFNYEYRNDTPVDGISLVAWLQRATMGRDQYIKVIERGYLFPFGHKAVKIIISERQVRMVNNVATAIMIYQTIIVVKQPELYYGKDQISDFVPFPFHRVEIKDLQKRIYEKKLSGIEAFELYKVSDTSKPDPFKIEVDDAAGNKIRLEVPLLFVDGAAKTQHPVVDYYSNAGWDYFTSSPTNRPVAYARSLVPGDTTFETQSLLFGAVAIPNKINNVDFFPEVNEASIYIKQMEALAGERKAVRIQLVDDNNLSMVFAKVMMGDNAALVFGNSEKSGGLITPNMAISGLSKLTGITGNNLDNLENLMVSVKDIFSIADKMPKLFGILNFVDLLIPDVPLSGAINTIRSTLEQVRNDIEALQRELMSIQARIDSDLKTLDVMLQMISSLLDETDVIGALQDVPKLAQALEAYGVKVPGSMPDAITATIAVGKEIKSKSVQLDLILAYANNAQGFKNKLSEAGVNMTSQLNQSVDKMLPLVGGLGDTGLGDVEVIGVVGALGLAAQLTDIQSLIKTMAAEVADKVLKAIPEIPNVKFQIKGNDVIVEYHWKPKTKEEYAIGDIFAIKNLKDGNNQIEVSVDSIMTKSIDLNNPPVFDVRASVKEFSLTIAQSIQLNFKKVEFKAGMSAKPDVDVKFQTVPIRMMGALSFVNSLQKVIKSDQFESGPFIDITENGIVAGYNFPIPNLEVGIFALSNMMLGAKLTLPFTKDPLKFGFNFCTRENPFRLMVSCFGGGGFFMMETTMQGLTRLDAAFEFGAGLSLNVGVASGSVEVMGGVFYTLTIKTVEGVDYKSQAFCAYLRMTGRLSIIGLIKVTLEFYLELRYEELGQKATPDGVMIAAGSRLVGTATLSVKVEVLFFSKTVKVTVSRTLAGNDADPKFEQTYKVDHWQSYCAAFAS